MKIIKRCPVCGCEDTFSAKPYIEDEEDDGLYSVCNCCGAIPCWRSMNEDETVLIHKSMFDKKYTKDAKVFYSNNNAGYRYSGYILDSERENIKGNWYNSDKYKEFIL